MSENASILQKIIHKVPGNPVQSKKEKQGYVNLAEKSTSDLLELIERQDKLLKNEKFLSRLPDKGEKISNYRKRLEDELRNREKSDQLSDMLSKLNIKGKEALDRLEWTGNCNPGQSHSGQDVIVIDNDEDEGKDPLKIIATHSGTSFQKKIHRVLPPEPSLIKPSDIENINKDLFEDGALKLPTKLKESDSTTEECDDLSLIEDPYVKNLCDKFDKLNNDNEVRSRFLPHRSINRGVEQVLNKHEKCRNLRRDVTAATPPLPVYNDTKLLPLEASVKLQIKQAEKLKEVQMRHATERLKLTALRGVGVEQLSGRSKERYRDLEKHYDTDSSGSGSSDEEDRQSFHSCHDDEEDTDEKRGGITFYNLIDN